MDSKAILQRYVTDTEGQVFSIVGLQGVVGAVMARYSRASTGLRETLIREFLDENGGEIKVDKASKLIDRVLIAYGDDSVGELEGAHLSFEGISMLATKVIEHRRIGGSPIEQSTRYVRFDEYQPETGYRYVTPDSLGEDAPGYRAAMDRIFADYGRMWEPLIDFLQKKKPIEEAIYELGEGSTLAEMKTKKLVNAFKRTYRNDIKTKACDILRAFLPLSTRANVGMFGNGRFFQNLISRLWTSELPEANQLGHQAFAQLSRVIPHYVKRAAPSPYIVETDRAMQGICAQYFADLKPGDDPETRLIEPDHDYLLAQMNGKLDAVSLGDAYRKEQDLNFLASLVYASVRGSFTAIRSRLAQLPASAHAAIMQAYYGQRKARRDRPERGIEHGYPYTFDLVTEWAVYKDLMRHRMATIMIQPMAPDLGFDMPAEIGEAGLEAIATGTLECAEQLYEFLANAYPTEREYAMLQGHRVRWLIGMNDRALMHMLELRTTPQGHPNYRRACQELHRLAAARFPERAEKMAFVNHSEIYWSREDSEAAQRRKEERLDSTT